MQLFGQRDPQWSGHRLGSGPDTIGSAGCLLTVNAMIVWDAFGDSHYNPAALDELFFSRSNFVSGELLTDAALANIWPDRFSWRRLNAWDHVQFDDAVGSADTYVIVGLAGPGTHFVLGYGKTGYIADPWTGKVGALGGYLDTGWHVTDMVFVTRHVATSAPPASALPAALPASTPVPIPHFVVEAEDDIVVSPPQSDLAVAKAKADELAHANLGRKYVVEDDAEKEVYVALVARDPGADPATIEDRGHANVPPTPPVSDPVWIAVVRWLLKLFGFGRPA